MKKYLLALTPVFFIVLPGAISSVQAAPAVRAVDVKSFDLGGVKTGMSIEEAQAAMQKNFSVSADKIKASKSRKDQIATLVTGSPQVIYLVYDENGTRMQVTFEPRIPYDAKNPMVAAIVTYEYPWTKDNENAMKEAALAKYGAVSTGGVYPIWCEDPMPSSGMGCQSGTAQLSMSSSGLTLTDPMWMEATSNYMDQKNATKPQF